MNKFSQTFVRYHGRGHCYLDGTNALIQTGRRCVMEKNNPFWKKQSMLVIKQLNQQEINLEQKQNEVI